MFGYFMSFKYLSTIWMHLLSHYLLIINTNLNIQLSSKDSTYLINNNLFILYIYIFKLYL